MTNAKTVFHRKAPLSLYGIKEHYVSLATLVPTSMVLLRRKSDQALNEKAMTDRYTTRTGRSYRMKVGNLRPLDRMDCICLSDVNDCGRPRSICGNSSKCVDAPTQPALP